MSRTKNHRHEVNRPAVAFLPSAAKSSVRNLQELYTVAVGVALVKAMEVFVGTPSEHVGGIARWTNWPALVALVVTLVPFYHGAMRHLDKTYVEDQGALTHRGALLADFLWLFIEAGILLGMALQLGELNSFAWWLVLLLLFDSAWGLSVHFLLTSKPRGWIEFRWAIVNVSTALVLVALLRWGIPRAPTLLWIAVPSIALVRTIIDYAWSWSFYFPVESDGSRPPM